MRIIYNENRDVVDAIRAGLKKKDGYCPCRLEKIEDNICMCKEFRDQIKAKQPGSCHCGLHVLVDK